MAREEEFDYVSYYCWVCGEFNQARKQRNRVRSAQIRPNSEQQHSELAPTSSSLPTTPAERTEAKVKVDEMPKKFT